MNFNKRLLTMAAAAVLAAGFAHAGARFDNPVSIDTVIRGASGALGSARNSPDGVQYIACVYHAFGLPEAQCVARNAAGLTRSCLTSNPAHLAAIAAINDDKSITFTWDESGLCTGVHIFADSRIAPKR